MNWNNYLLFAIPTICCWIFPVFINEGKRHVVSILYLSGIIVYASFIMGLWYNQGYPPLRTMNDTRLWYSLFLASTGYILYINWNYKWLLSFIGGFASIFVLITICKPKIENDTFYPVLQTIWFIPHVILYILSYSLLLLATIGEYCKYYKQKKERETRELERITDNLISLGTVFLIMGLLIGMQWANEAWGSFWSWDIKEIWALITLLTYLLIYHIRLKNYNQIVMLILLTCGLLFFMITWLGIEYLPNKDSLHLYS